MILFLSSLRRGLGENSLRSKKWVYGDWKLEYSCTLGRSIGGRENI